VLARHAGAECELAGGAAERGMAGDSQFSIDEYTMRPLILENHRAVASDEPGVGVDPDWSKLAPHLVKTPF